MKRNNKYTSILVMKDDIPRDELKVRYSTVNRENPSERK